MIKLGPAGNNKGGNKWKEKFRTQILQIFIWYDDTCIDSIQFQYVENGRLVLSPKYGSGFSSTSYNFEAVKFDYPSEQLVSLSVGEANIRGIASLTFGTNQGTHGPYGVQNTEGKTSHFEMGEGQFAGFYGTEEAKMLMSIGVYFKPVITTLSNSEKTRMKFRMMINDLHDDVAANFVWLFSLEGLCYVVVLLMFLLWLLT